MRQRYLAMFAGYFELFGFICFVEVFYLKDTPWFTRGIAGLGNMCARFILQVHVECTRLVGINRYHRTNDTQMSYINFSRCLVLFKYSVSML